MLSIADIVDRMRPHIPLATSQRASFQTHAGTLAYMTFGLEVLKEEPSVVNIAGLALSMTHLVVHRISAGATRPVEETDLRTMPGEPPLLLKGPWIVTSRKPGRGDALFGQTVELAGYPEDGVIYLIGLDYPDGIKVVPWRPHWAEKDIEISTGGRTDLILQDLGEWEDWGKQAVRFAVILGLLLDAEGTPLYADGPQLAGDTGGRRSQGASKPAKPGKWATRRVFVDANIYRASAPDGAGPSEDADMSGRREARVMISGFVRRQPYGPGNSLRKWVYIAAYEARRWIVPGSRTRVDVGSVAEGD